VPLNFASCSVTQNSSMVGMKTPIDHSPTASNRTELIVELVYISHISNRL